MPEFDRVLDVLLHDLRSPLSVASGYVRLLRLGRLASPEDQDKAWTQTANALSRMAHLCDEAAMFLPSSAGARRSVAVGALILNVRQRCQSAGVTLGDRGSVDAEGLALQSRTDLDQLASAIAALLAQGHAPAAPATALASVDPESRRLDFTIRLGKAPASPEAPEASLDPWYTQGLALALACHVVTLASGQVRCGRELTISFPLQDVRS